MRVMSVTLDTRHFEILPLKYFVPLNMPNMLVTFDTVHLERSLLKYTASMNVPNMSVTRDTFHFETSPRKVEESNTLVMSVNLDTSHSPIGPLGPPEQSSLRDSLMHAFTAVASSEFDRGEYDGRF